VVRDVIIVFDKPRLTARHSPKTFNHSDIRVRSDTDTEATIRTRVPPRQSQDLIAVVDFAVRHHKNLAIETQFRRTLKDLSQRREEVRPAEIRPKFSRQSQRCSERIVREKHCRGEKRDKSAPKSDNIEQRARREGMDEQFQTLTRPPDSIAGHRTAAVNDNHKFKAFRRTTETGWKKRQRNAISGNHCDALQRSVELSIYND
jgi:hypothetical protein